MTLKDARIFAKLIGDKVKKDSKPPTDNQNCMLCTWCFEGMARGNFVLPRPVYSPRDMVFKIDSLDIIDHPIKEKFTSKQDLINLVSKNKDSRYYVHVKWSDNSGGGHEFLVINADGPYLVDSQEGKVIPMNDKASDKYLKDISYKNSFTVRLDDKKFKSDVLSKTNDKKNTIEWDDKIDMPYVKKHKLA